MMLLRVGLVVIGLLCGVSQYPVSGQGMWTEASTLGYGATAFGLGVAACWSCDYDTAGIAILAAGVGGLFLGHRIGGSAEGSARRGEVLSSGQLWGARIGTVTGFSAVGAVVAAVLINSTEGNAEGEDERRLRNYSLAAAGVGVLVEVLQEKGLSSGSAAPPLGILAEPTSLGGVRIGLRSLVPW